MVSGLTEKRTWAISQNQKISQKAHSNTPRQSWSIHQENQQKYLNIKFVINKPVPAPRKAVKQMVEEYENNIIPPPTEFRDKPISAPRTKKTILKDQLLHQEQK